MVRGSDRVDAGAYLASQPPELRVPEALERIRAEIDAGGRRLVVLDDDPTGTQTVHGVPVLTAWSVDDLRWAFEQVSSTFYVLTNSRSFPEEEAARMNREISTNLAAAAERTDTEFVVVSRGDSTLRGHYPAETDALEEGLGTAFAGVVLCPCYLEAGRLTVDDVHWVRQGEWLVPAGESEFARDDASFGYSASNLAAWVEEKTMGRVHASGVASVSLSDIREGGPERVAEILLGVRGGRPVVVNAASYPDLYVFVLGLLDAEARGKRFLYRTGPSFVRARGGISEKGPLGTQELYARRPRQGHGLVLVGSHVEMTTRQLEHAIALEGVRSVELSVPRLLDDAERDGEVGRVVSEVNRGLAEAEVVVYTSREVVRGVGQTGFEIGVSVSDALVEVMRRVDRRLPLAFVVAKGGITSSDVGTRGLGVRRAEVAGQMLPGIISVWILPEDSAFPGLPYVIFAGNVGEEDSLARVIEILREE